MPAAARKGDQIIHAGAIGEILQGSDNVLCNGIPLARVGDACYCKIHGTVQIATGSTTVFANGKGVARIGDQCTCGATIITGSGSVFVGG